MDKFQLYLSQDKEFYIPISPLVIEYLKEKIVMELLKDNNIILETKWVYIFTIKVSKTNFIDSVPRILLYERVSGLKKLCGAIISRDVINESKNLNEELINAIVSSLKLFLLSSFKKLKENNFDDFSKSIDYNFLFELEFPVNLSEKNLIGNSIEIPLPVY
jgi:hypothetical protein